jgi:hypothetical protein
MWKIANLFMAVRFRPQPSTLSAAVKQRKVRETDLSLFSLLGNKETSKRVEREIWRAVERNLEAPLDFSHLSPSNKRNRL